MRRTLHRDISVGNIIISPKLINGVTTTKVTEGRLIDLDRANHAKNSIASLLHQAKSQLPLPSSSKLRGGVQTTFQSCFDAILSDDVIDVCFHAIRCGLPIVPYVAAILDYKPSLRGSTVCAFCVKIPAYSYLHTDIRRGHWAAECKCIIFTYQVPCSHISLSETRYA